jgi:hypothetical protein
MAGGMPPRGEQLVAGGKFSIGDVVDGTTMMFALSVRQPWAWAITEGKTALCGGPGSPPRDFT